MERQHFSPIIKEFKKRGLLWLPFLLLLLILFCFEIMPAIYILFTSFKGEKSLTLDHYVVAFTHRYYIKSLKNSIGISLSSAFIAIVAGLAASLSFQSCGEELSQRFLTLINMTTNFSGVPLAFAYIILLGSSGIFTILMKNLFHIDPYQHGFNLFSWSGIILVYVYFQIPLSIMLLYPAVYQIRKDIKEAALTLGATRYQFWKEIGLPTLMPSIGSTFCVLFANALGAYATAYALVNANKGILSIAVANLVSGDLTADPALACALAAIMGGILMILLLLNQRLLRRINPSDAGGLK